MAAVVEFYAVFRPNINAAKMQLCDAFVEKLRGTAAGLHDWVLLRNRAREEFHVQLLKESGQLYFHEGWPEFVEANGLIMSTHFLLFRYDGVTTFDVKIYDYSGCEKYAGGQDEDDDDDAEEASQGGDALNSQDTDYVEEDADDTDYYEDSEADSHTSGSIPAPNGSTRAEGSNTRGRGAGRPYRRHVWADPDAELIVEPGNLYFVAGRGLGIRKNQVAVPNMALRDFNMELDDKIIYYDPAGRQYVGRVSKWKTNQKWIGGWSSFCGTNQLSTKDKCICEFIMGEERKCSSMIVHIIRNGFN
ncbi:unnamed protein product [Rhodiola kirilowii]